MDLRRGKKKKSTKCNRSYKFEHFIYKMLNTIKYNISISLGFDKFMATKCDNNGRPKKIAMDYTK